MSGPDWAQAARDSAERLNREFPPMTASEYADLVSVDQRNRWRGFVDGLTDPRGERLRITPDDPTDYVQGAQAGSTAYWQAYNEELRGWEGPF